MIYRKLQCLEREKKKIHSLNNIHLIKTEDNKTKSYGGDKSKLKITKLRVMVETSAKEDLQSAWSWVRELAKEANQLSMTTTKSKWLPISKLYIV